MKKIKVIAYDKTGTLICGGEDCARNGLRSGATDAVRALSKYYRAVMISGDKAEIAEQVGALVGVKQVFSEVKPEGKADVIRSLQKEGPVMMVGDGINDAPAMAVSDPSVSIQNGTDFARDTEEVILLGDDVSKLPLAFELSRLNQSCPS